MTRSFLVVSSFNPEDARRAVLASPLETDFAVISLSDPDPETADDLERTVPLP
jgi:precorrin-3B methylase